MQMRKSYHTTNRKKRAEQHRQDERECAAGEFWDAANVNQAMAALLDPYIEPDGV
jgi:hypothetical protein